MTFDERKQEGIKYIKEDNYKKAYEIFSILFYENQKDEELFGIAQFLWNRILEGNYDFQPVIAEEFIFRGVSKFYKGELTDSIEDYNTALKLNPKLDYAHKCKAFSLMKQEKYLLAIEELKKAIQIKEHGEYYDDVAENLSRLGLWKEAIDYHEMAIKVAPDDARLWYNYGTHLGEMNMIAGAVLKFQRAIELFPNYDDAKVNLDYYYKKLQNI